MFNSSKILSSSDLSLVSNSLKSSNSKSSQVLVASNSLNIA